MNVHLAYASAVETQLFAMYEVWIPHASTRGAARHTCRNDDKNFKNKLFGAELLRVPLSALVSGNQVVKLSPWDRRLQIVASDWKHNSTKVTYFRASHFHPSQALVHANTQFQLIVKHRLMEMCYKLFFLRGWSQKNTKSTRGSRLVNWLISRCWFFAPDRGCQGCNFDECAFGSCQRSPNTPCATDLWLAIDEFHATNEQTLQIVGASPYIWHIYQYKLHFHMYWYPAAPLRVFQARRMRFL